MPVKQMKPGDIQEVSRIVTAAFLDSIAEGLSEKGIATFKELSSPEAFARRMNEDNCMFVYEEQGQIMGMIELKEGRHVAMMFVSPIYQNQGVGRELIQVALSHSRVQSVTVSAALPSVAAYQRYGFEVVGVEQEKQGLRYIPMEIDLTRHAGKRDSK